jgi:hypothetical protein
MTTNVGGTSVTVVTAAPLGVAVNDTCLVFHPKFYPGSFNFHGQQEVVSVAGNTVTFGANIGTAAFSYKSGGLLKGKATRTFNVFTALFADSIAKRSRGFAELAIRGRSRSRRNFVG